MPSASGAWAKIDYVRNRATMGCRWHWWKRNASVDADRDGNKQNSPVMNRCSQRPIIFTTSGFKPGGWDDWRYRRVTAGLYTNGTGVADPAARWAPTGGTVPINSQIVSQPYQQRRHADRARGQTTAEEAVNHGNQLR